MAKVEEAGQAGAEVVCLPELYRSTYFCQREDPALFDLAEPIPGPSTEAMTAAAKRAGVAVLVPVFERRAPGLYHNSVVVVDRGGEVRGTYRKMHIPDDPAFYEKYYFTPGDLGLPRLRPRSRAGRNPHLLGPVVSGGGAPHRAAGGGGALLSHRHRLASSRESSNTAPLSAMPGRPSSGATPSPTGSMWPPSTVSAMNPAPPGRPGWSSGARASCAIRSESSWRRLRWIEEETLTGEIDLARIEEVRRNWPFLRDRRIDAYRGIDQRYLDRT